jgi:chromate transporter
MGFTLPSALLLVGFAYLSGWVDPGVADGVTHGLMVVAVAVVAQAVVQMSRSLAPDLVRRVMAVAAMAVLLLAPTALMQIAVLIAGGVIGFLVLVPPSGVDHPRIEVPVGRGLGGALIALFFLLLAVLPLLAAGGGVGIEVADIFYRAGALVFGGGHVVLPILEAELVPSGLIARDTFLAGYGAAQAVPGPLFSFAAYVGAMATHGGLLLAAVALIAMFGPSFLLVPGLLPFWFGVSRRRWMRAALMGINAGVVGLLAAAFVTPIFTSAILSVFDLGLAIAAWAALQWSPAPVWLVVLITGTLGLLLV